MTKQEQIDEMANIIKADYKQWLDITGVFPEGSSYYFECLGGGEDCAELLYKAGYGDVSEYKAEIKRLKTKLFEQEQLTKQAQQNYNNAFVRLKTQQQEIERLRTTLGQCNTELNSALESLKSQCREIGELKAGVKQAQIDVLNKLKKYLHTEDFDTPDERWKPESEFCAIIDEIIKEVQNDEDKG